MAVSDVSDGDMALFVCLLFCGDVVHTPRASARTQGLPAATVWWGVVFREEAETTAWH